MPTARTPGANRQKAQKRLEVRLLKDWVKSPLENKEKRPCLK
jgi:hypothetical protein